MVTDDANKCCFSVAVLESIICSPIGLRCTLAVNASEINAIITASGVNRFITDVTENWRNFKPQEGYLPQQIAHQHSYVKRYVSAVERVTGPGGSAPRSGGGGVVDSLDL